MTFNRLCAVLAHEQLAKRIEAFISGYFQTLHSTNPRDLFFNLRKYNICTICFHLDEHGFQTKIELKRLQTDFPLVPIVAIVTKFNVELIRYCGELGIPYVISENELHTLRIILAKLCRRNEISSYLQKYKNETIHKSKIINKALDFILENFTQIETCTDIADYLGISSTHLSREFKSHLSIAPKKLLLTIKLAYSIQMMKNPGLKLFEISDLAGLGNLKRLNELCHKIFSTSPSNIRKSACNPKAIHFIELQLKHYLNCSKRVE